MQGKLFIISAPSGAGKTTLVQHLIERLNHTYSISRVLTYTTKSPRPQEKDKEDYYFVSQQEFEQKIAQGYFLEWSNAYGHYYGSPRSLLEKMANGHSFVLIVDQAGARQIKAQVPDCVLIWLYTSSLQVLQKRLMHRASENDKQMQVRLALAQAEIKNEREQRFYEFHVLNEDFLQALNELFDICVSFYR